VKIWDVLRSRPVVFHGHTGWVTRVAFRRDGQRIASKTENYFRTGDETIKVWDPATTEEDPPPGFGATADLIPDFGAGGRMRGASSSTGTSPDGKRIAESERTVVHVKDAATGEVLTTLKGHTGWIFSLNFSLDGRRIATASDDQTIKIWDTEDGREMLTLRGHTHAVGCLAFSPDGHRLASGSVDTTVRVWDATPFPPEVLREQEARRLVPLANRDVLFQSRDEVIEWLRVDETHSPTVRAAALAIVEPLADDPELLNDASWSSVRTPAARRDDYPRALHRAEAAVRLVPENGTYLKTLGVAFYRVGRYKQALEALRRATALDTARRGGPTPTELTFLAMTHWQLGDKSQARSWYDKAVQWMDMNQSKDEELIGFLAEAAELLDVKGAKN
jgi:hypothetical protein